MPKTNIKKVQGSIEFRDAVLHGPKDKNAFVRMEGTDVAFRIVGVQFGDGISLGDLFEHPLPPINMEDFATALAKGADAGDVPVMEVWFK